MFLWQRYCCFTTGLAIERARAGSCTASLASLAATARLAGLAELAGVAGLAGLAYLAGLAPASGHGLERCHEDSQQGHRLCGFPNKPGL